MNINKSNTAVVFIDPQNEGLSDNNSRNVPFEPSDQIAAAPLESIVCTQELRNRPSRSPEYEKENRALAVLASALADSPRPPGRPPHGIHARAASPSRW